MPNRPNILIDGPDRSSLSVILAHGAGAAMDTDFMNTVAEGIANEGIRVVRFEFPYSWPNAAKRKKRPLTVHQPNQRLVRLFPLGDLFGRPSKRFERSEDLND